MRPWWVDGPKRASGAAGRPVWRTGATTCALSRRGADRRPSPDALASAPRVNRALLARSRRRPVGPAIVRPPAGGQTSSILTSLRQWVWRHKRRLCAVCDVTHASFVLADVRSARQVLGTWNVRLSLSNTLSIEVRNRPHPVLRVPYSTENVAVSV